jgi:hypothetical protein
MVSAARTRTRLLASISAAAIAALILVGPTILAGPLAPAKTLGLDVATGLRRSTSSPAPDPAPVLTPTDLAGRLSRKGYGLQGQLTRRGANYLATATDAKGRLQRLVVDGRTAEVVGMRYIRRPD